jgi:hypothetical protein
MTWILRNAFLALVAFATLAIIIMMAMTAQAKDLTPSTTTAQATSPADTPRQIVVEETKDKPVR